MKCYKCSKEMEIISGEKIRRSAICPACNSYLHCCLNCRYYDRSAPNQCREPAAELVRDKDIGNYCEYFDPQRNGDQGSISGRSARDAKAQWDSLFKK